jgi:hypothetical protein
LEEHAASILRVEEGDEVLPLGILNACTHEVRKRLPHAGTITKALKSHADAQKYHRLYHGRGASLSLEASRPASTALRTCRSSGTRYHGG